MKAQTETPKTQLGVNPKDLVGRTKVSMFKLPASAIAWGSAALMDGDDKYGAYNWRGNKVIASVYIDAMERHLKAWQEGRRVAPDSKVHELGHVIACAAILIDAEATGNLHDDRQGSYEALQTIFDEIHSIRLAKADALEKTAALRKRKGKKRHAA